MNDAEVLREARADGYGKGVADAQGVYIRAGYPRLKDIGGTPTSPYRKKPREAATPTEVSGE